MQNPEDLQVLVNGVAVYSDEFGLSLNIRKTKVMMISKQQKALQIHQQTIERVRN